MEIFMIFVLAGLVTIILTLSHRSAYEKGRYDAFSESFNMIKEIENEKS